MAWSKFEVGELSITNEDVAANAGIAATKLNFLPSDIDAVIRSVQSKASDIVSVKDFGAKGDGITNDTDAIDAALATGKTIYFPQGTYMTTGGHRTFGNAQGILGDGHMESIIKKLSGDGELFRVSQGFNFQWCSKIGFDCNGLGGTAVRWKGHYSYMRDVRIFNGSTDPNQWGLHFTGCNLSYFDGVFIEETANCILIDSNNDEPWPGPFQYSLLYTGFSNIVLVPRIGQAIKISGQAMDISFDKIYMESISPYDPPHPPFIQFLNPSPIANISFYNLGLEHHQLQSTFMEMIGTSAAAKEIYNISFRGGRWTSGTIGQDKPLLKARYVDNLILDGAFFYCDQNLPLRPHIEIQDCSNVKVANCSVYSYPNDFIFIKDNGGCEWVTDDTNTRLRINSSGGGGYNQWGNSTNICSINSGMTQSYSGTTRVTDTSNQLAPLVRAYRSSANGLAHNTLTKWAFSTVDAGYNPNGDYDVSTYRFTPTVRGFYSVTISGVLNAATDDCVFLGAIYKNGSEFSRSETTGTGSLGINLTDVVFLNGTTDFIEGYFYQFNNTSATVRNVAANAFFTSNFVRSV